VVVFFAWAIAVGFGVHYGVSQIGRKRWIYPAFSGLATGRSWICYFRALSLSPASKVAPVDTLSIVFVISLAWPIPGESITAGKAIGGSLIAVGAVVLGVFSDRLLGGSERCEQAHANPLSRTLREAEGA
jgi:transporter family protein